MKNFYEYKKRVYYNFLINSPIFLSQVGMFLSTEVS